MGETSANSAPQAVYVGALPPHGAEPPPESVGVFLLEPTGPAGALVQSAMAQAPAPAWIALHPNGRFLYAGNEVGEFEGRPGGVVMAFSLDRASGQPTLVNHQQTVEVGIPHCSVDRSGRWLLATTYQTGAVYVFPIAEDGALGPVRDVHRFVGSSIHPRQRAPHAHSVTSSPDNRFVLIADLGTDSVWIFGFDSEQGRVEPRPDRTVTVAPGSGPRHMAFHPDGAYVYLLNEIGATLVAYAYDAVDGELRELQTVSTVPDGFPGFRSGSEIGMHPSGRFLYATNRSSGGRDRPPVPGEDSIVCFAVDPQTGTLSETSRIPSGGEIPRNFTIDRSGERMYVANQESDLITIFDVDLSSGELTATGSASVLAPVCLQLVES